MLGAQHWGILRLAHRAVRDVVPRRTAAALLTAIVTLLVVASAASAAPTVTNILFANRGPDGLQYIEADGTGFGNQPPPGTTADPGYTGSDYGDSFYFCDTVGFCAGQFPDQIGLVVSSWSDTSVQFIFGSAYLLFYPNPANQILLSNGDHFTLSIKGAICGGFIVSGQSFPCVPVPTVATGTATNVKSSSATLTGMVNPNGSPLTDCHFNYGSTTPHSVPCSQAGIGGTSPVAVSADVSGLTPGVRYSVQLVASNVGGTQIGAPQAFDTPHTAAPSTAQIRAQLLKQLVPTAKSASILALLGNGGYSFWFTAPTGGQIVIDWQYDAEGGTRSGVASRAVVVATGSATFPKARRVKVTVKLTATGKRIVQAGKRLRLTAKGTYAIAGHRPVIAAKSFTLGRR